MIFTCFLAIINLNLSKSFSPSLVALVAIFLAQLVAFHLPCKSCFLTMAINALVPTVLGTFSKTMEVSVQRLKEMT